MILPPREKKIRPREWHLYCCGEGCDARLAIRIHHCAGCEEGLDVEAHVHDDRGEPFWVSLEPGYSQDPSDDYSFGYWWRIWRGTVNMPRGKDIRGRVEAYKKREPVREDPAFSPLDSRARVPLFERQIPKRWSGDRDLSLEQQFRHMRLSRQELEDFLNRYTTGRYKTGGWKMDRAIPDEGQHVVVCYDCGGKAKIDAPHNPSGPDIDAPP